jgi:hydroxylamine reductase (hybrid-cluster protein)
MDFTRPTVQFGDIVIDVYNSKIKMLGKPEWQDVTVNLRDDAAGNVTRLVGEQLQKQYDFMEQASAAAGIDYKFITRCEMLDGGNGVNQPNVLETWELYGCYVSQVNYGEVNYASGTDLVKIALTIKFDNAVQTPLGYGVGSDVGRLNGETATG